MQPSGLKDTASLPTFKFVEHSFRDNIIYAIINSVAKFDTKKEVNIIGSISSL